MPDGRLRAPGFRLRAPGLQEFTMRSAVLLLVAALVLGQVVVAQRRAEPQAADGSTPLHAAVRDNNLREVEALLKQGASVKATSRYNVPVLYHAALNGNATIIDRL